MAAAREPDLGRRWTRLQEVLDTEGFITLLAWTTITWNWDGYPMGRNNYRVYHDPETDRLGFLPHGLDQMFWEPRGSIYPPWRGLVAVALMQVPEARQQDRQRLAAASDWQELICALTVPGPAREVELVCEARSVEGEVWFELESLQLRRSTRTRGWSLMDLFR